MKDSIKRSIITTISLIIITYLVYYFYNGVFIVNELFINYNTAYYLSFIILFIYIAIIYGIKPLYIKNNKIILFLIGFFILLSGKFTFNNDGNNSIYFGDIFIVIGGLISILSRTNIMISEKVLKINRNSKKIEIIEA